MRLSEEQRPRLGPSLGATLQAISEQTGIRRAALAEACKSGDLRHSRINRKTYWIYWADFHRWLEAQSHHLRKVSASEHAQAVLTRNAERRAQRSKTNGRKK